MGAVEMSSAVTVWGKLKLASRDLRRWRAATIDSEALGMSPDGDPLELDGEVPALTPDEILNDVEEAGLFVDVRITDTQVTVEAFITDDWVPAWCANLGALWRSAAAYGGRGTLTLVPADGERAARLDVANGGASVTLLREYEVDTGAAWKSIAAKVKAKTS